MTADRLRTLALPMTLVALALVTLPGGGASQPKSVDLCLVCGPNGAASGMLNVALFIPLGVALWWRCRAIRRVVIIGALTSLTIEMAQLFIAGRHTALSDLVANTVGAGLGGALAIRPIAWILPRGAAARAAALTVVLVASCMLVVAGLLFRPSVAAGDYYGQWTPRGPYSPSYDGAVLDARLGDVPLPSTRIVESARVRVLIGERAPLRLRFVSGSVTPTLTPVFRLVAGPYDGGIEALQIGVDGPALVLTPRFVADDYRLMRPEVQVADALAGRGPGDTVTVEFQPRPDHGFDVRVDDRPPFLVGYTVARSWSLLYQTTLRAERALRTVDLTWLFGLAAALGWFALGPYGATGLLIVLATAGLTPLWTDLLPTPVADFAALLAGFAVGLLARRAVESAHRRDGAQTS